MSMANLTTSNGDGINIAAFLSVLNIFLSITAIVGNSLILMALREVSSLHSPTKLLFRCLAVTDLFVGLIPQPLFAVTIFAEITTINLDPDVLHYIAKVKSSSSYILCTVSVYTSTVVSVDRLLALLLELRYRQIITVRRVFVAVTCFWLTGASCGLTYIWRNDIAWSMVLVSFIILLVTSGYCYTKIYLKLRHQQAQLHGQNQIHQGASNTGGMSLNIARYKKTVASIWWVQVALILCYVPFVIAATLRIHGGLAGNAMKVARDSVVTLTYFNSSLNPFLYCWKMREVRQAVKNILRKLNCCKSN